MRKSFYILLIAAAASLLSACSHDIVYSRFVPISTEEWTTDSVLRFDYTIQDAAADYRIIVYVRHSERYPYQNMWLFCSFGTPLDSVTLWHNDTIEFYLADDRGQWLGNKAISYMEMPVLFAQNYRFHREGEYQFTITQAMRETLLRGVSDVGLIVRKSE